MREARHKLYYSIHTKCPEQVNLWGQKADQWFPRTGVGGTWGVAADAQGVPFGGDENVLELLDSGNDCTALNRLKATGLCDLSLNFFNI